MEKRKYVVPSVETITLEQSTQILAGSTKVPSGPGTSVDYGTGAARENDFDDWDEEF